MLFVLAFFDLSYALVKVVTVRSEVFAVQAACKHCNLRMRNLRRTAGGTDATHDAVEGFFCALVVFAALCVCNVLHYVQALCTCIGTCITADTCINLRVELHHNLLARVDFFHVVYCLYQREERKSSNIHIVLNLRGAGKTGLQVPLEVKAETNLQAKSLKVFAEKYSPKVSLRLSMADYQDNGHLINIPLYAAGTIAEYLCKKEN